MEKMTCSVPCLFGLEGLVGDELRRLDMDAVRVENGRVLFDGSLADVARANVRLRMGERVLIRLGAFPANTFEELYQGVRALPGLVYERLRDLPPVPVFRAEYVRPERNAGGRGFTVTKLEDHTWNVEAPWLERILAGSNVDDYESLQYFQRQLSESGILDALVEQGVEENDTILIGEYQFDYIF